MIKGKLNHKIRNKYILNFNNFIYSVLKEIDLSLKFITISAETIGVEFFQHRQIYIN